MAVRSDTLSHGVAEIRLANGVALAHAAFARAGHDLVIRSDGRELVIHHYFEGAPATLVGGDGTRIAGADAARLALLGSATAQADPQDARSGPPHPAASHDHAPTGHAATPASSGHTSAPSDHAPASADGNAATAGDASPPPAPNHHPSTPDGASPTAGPAAIDSTPPDPPPAPPVPPMPEMTPEAPAVFTLAAPPTAFGPTLASHSFAFSPSPAPGSSGEDAHYDVALALAPTMTPPPLASELPPSRILPGFDSGHLPASDDDYAGPVALGFTVQIAANSFTTAYVSNNGYLTFGGPQFDFVPVALGAAYRGAPIVAPFFSDADTRTEGAVTYGTGSFAGHAAFAATWTGVAPYGGAPGTDTFQVVLVDRSDTGPGDIDVYFNYGHIGWDAAPDGLGGTHAASVGLSAGTGETGTFAEVAGSLAAGSFLDGGTMPLVADSNDGVPGQYLFHLHDGMVASGGGNFDGGVITTIITGSIMFGSSNPGILLVGTAGDDTLVGTAGDDTILGGAGNDLIQGLGGNDSLDGGPGNDTIQGGLGDDVYSFAPGSGNDLVQDAGGNDLLKIALADTDHALFARTGAGGGDLTVTLPDGGSIEVSGAFAGTGRAIEQAQLHTNGAVYTIQQDLAGTAGDDLIVGTGAADSIDGGLGDDLLYGGAGDDTLAGGDGSDILVGGRGDDVLMGGASGNIYVYGAGDGHDSIVGAYGFDTLEFSGVADGPFNDAVHLGDDLVINQSDGGSVTIVGEYAANRVPTLVDDVTHATFYLSPNNDVQGSSTATLIAGTDAKDILGGSSAGDILLGNGGDDVLIGREGADTLTGGAGADTFFYRGPGDGTFVATNGTTATMGDTIRDFQHGTDRILVAPDTFSLASAHEARTLVEGQDFSTIGTAYDGTNPGANAAYGHGGTFIFSTATDTLYFDANGAAPGYTVVTTVEGGVTLHASDVHVPAS